MERLAWQIGYVRRLPTAAARLRFIWWYVICRWPTESCEECGRPVGKWLGSWWTTDDDLWIEVVEPEHIEEGKWRRIGSGILCPSCFTARCSAKGIQIFWQARVEYRDGEDVEAGQRSAGLRSSTSGAKIG